MNYLKLIGGNRYIIKNIEKLYKLSISRFTAKIDKSNIFVGNITIIRPTQHPYKW
jgi:hypothetical protein